MQSIANVEHDTKFYSNAFNTNGSEAINFFNLICFQIIRIYILKLNYKFLVNHEQ